MRRTFKRRYSGGSVSREMGGIPLGPSRTGGARLAGMTGSRARRSGTEGLGLVLDFSTSRWGSRWAQRFFVQPVLETSMEGAPPPVPLTLLVASHPLFDEHPGPLHPDGELGVWQSEPQQQSVKETV